MSELSVSDARRLAKQFVAQWSGAEAVLAKAEGTAKEIRRLEEERETLHTFLFQLRKTIEEAQEQQKSHHAKSLEVLAGLQKKIQESSEALDALRQQIRQAEVDAKSQAEAFAAESASQRDELTKSLARQKAEAQGELSALTGEMERLQKQVRQIAVLAKA